VLAVTIATARVATMTTMPPTAIEGGRPGTATAVPLDAGTSATRDTDADTHERREPPPAALPATSLLQLIWLASPALPVGGFSYSEGLEAAVDRGLVTNEPSAANWLADQLHLTLARGDLAACAGALEAWRAGDTARVQALNTWVLATRETSELRLQSTQMGRSLVEWLRNHELGGEGSPWPARVGWLAGIEPTWPVAFALAVAPTQAGVRDALLALAFGWAENMMQAALKAVPLGQSAGQRILARLARDIPAAVDHALTLDDDSRQAFSPMLAILSAQHEAQYSRLFRS
jgi:urease accessory protein